MRISALAGSLALVAGGLLAAPTIMTPHQTEVRATHAPTNNQVPAQPQPDRQAIREAAIPTTSRVRYRRGVPAAIKNRAGGERAHRRWRKSWS